MKPQQFKALREQHDLTQVECSALLGVSQQTVADWERGNSRVPRLQAWCMTRPYVMRLLAKDPPTDG